MLHFIIPNKLYNRKHEIMQAEKIKLLITSHINHENAAKKKQKSVEKKNFFLRLRKISGVIGK